MEEKLEEFLSQFDDKPPDVRAAILQLLVRVNPPAAYSDPIYSRIAAADLLAYLRASRSDGVGTDEFYARQDQIIKTLHVPDDVLDAARDYRRPA